MRKKGNRVFIICPVKHATQYDKKFLSDYVDLLEDIGCEVHYPPRDTKQTDPKGRGYNICQENKEAMRWSDEVHVYWTKGSEGSRFDLGMASMSEKPIYLINSWAVDKTKKKSIQNVAIEMHKKYEKS